MDLTNYSSVFELLCGYNFVNALDNKGVLAFLNFSTPINHHITDLTNNIQKKIDIIRSQSPGLKDGIFSKDGDDKLEVLFECRKKVRKLEDKNKNLDQSAPNLYLLAGVYSFYILLIAAFMDTNSWAYTLAYILPVCLMLMIMMVFATRKFCERVRYRAFLISSLLFMIVLFTIEEFGHFIWANFIGRPNLALLAIAILAIISFVILKRRLKEKRLYSTFYWLFYMVGTFLVFSKAGLIADQFPERTGEGIKALLLIISFLLAIAPMLYELFVRTFLISNKLTVLEKKVSFIAVMSENTGKAVTLNSTNPIAADLP